ncbi:hypothetical protein EJB05_18383, partial [Eragrostis curvula]
MLHICEQTLTQDIPSNNNTSTNHGSSPNDSAGVEVEAGEDDGRLNSPVVVPVDGAVDVMPTDVVALVTVVVVAVAAGADDGATVKLNALVEAVADGAVDAPVAETEANVGVEAAAEPNEKADVPAEELPAALVFENSEGADAACEVAKEKPVEGVDAGVAEAGDVLLANEKPEAEEAENREAAVFAAVALANEPNDGAVVAAVAGDEAVAVLKSGAEVVDPNSDEPVAAPNPRAGADAGVEGVLDAAAPELSEKPNAGVDAAPVVAVEPDVDTPKPNPVAAPEKRLGVDAAEEAAPNRLGVVAAAEVAPNGLGVVAAEEVAPNKPGVVAADGVAPNRLGVGAAADVAPNRPGVAAGAEVAPNRLGVVVAEPVAAPKSPGELAAVEAAPNKLGVVAAEEAGVAPKGDGADAAEEAAAVDCPNEKPVDPKPKGEGEEADAAADGAPNGEEPKAGAEEAAADGAPKGEEPKAGAGEEPAAGCEKEKADGAEEKEKGEGEEEPAAPPPKLNPVAMAGAAPIWARF